MRAHVTQRLCHPPAHVDHTDPVQSRKSRLIVNMSAPNYASHRCRISFDPTESAPAPVEEGQISGYFSDQLTRELLGLGAEDKLMLSGNYGVKEPGIRPVKFSHLRDTLSDRRLLPFASTTSSQLAISPFEMHVRNEQYYVRTDSLKAMRTYLDSTLNQVLAIAPLVQRSPPAYVTTLMPRINYNWAAEQIVNPYQNSFPYQFLPYFTPAGCRMRWIRLWRLAILGECYLNLAFFLTNPDGGWTQGNPIGITVDCAPRNADDLQLLRAYYSLGVPISGNLPDLSLVGYTKADVLNYVLGPSLDENKDYHFGVIELLASNDDDGLVWSDFNSSYDTDKFDLNGYRLTKAGRKSVRAEKLAEAQEEDDDSDGPYEPSSSSQAMTTYQLPELQLYNLGDIRRAVPSPSSLAPPGNDASAGPSTPTSTSELASTSASDAPQSGDGYSSSSRHHRQNDRSRNFRGTSQTGPRRRKKGPKGAKRGSSSSNYVQGSSSSHYQPYPPSSQGQRGPSSSGQQRLPPAAHYQQSSREYYGREHDAALARTEPYPPAPYEAPIRMGPALAARQSREVFRDSDTGALHPVNVTETSFTALGISPSISVPSDPPYSRGPHPSSSYSRPPSSYSHPSSSYSRPPPPAPQGYADVGSSYVPTAEQAQSAYPRRPPPVSRSYSGPSTDYGSTMGWGASEPPDVLPEQVPESSAAPPSRAPSGYPARESQDRRGREQGRDRHYSRRD